MNKQSNEPFANSETQVVKLYDPKRASSFCVLFKRGKVVRVREGFRTSDLAPLSEKLAGRAIPRSREKATLTHLADKE